MLVGDGGNIAVQMGEQGALVVDTGAGQLDGGTRPGGTMVPESIPLAMPPRAKWMPRGWPE